MKLRTRYLLLAGVLLVAEVLIATKLAHLPLIRGSLGDVLVTVLIFGLVQAVRPFERFRLATAVFAFACAVELSQFLGLADALGLRRGSVLRIIVGDSFQWGDVACYFVGCVLAVGVDLILAGSSSDDAPG